MQVGPQGFNIISFCTLEKQGTGSHIHSLNFPQYNLSTSLSSEDGTQFLYAFQPVTKCQQPLAVLLLLPVPCWPESFDVVEGEPRLPKHHPAPGRWLNYLI